MASVRFNLKTKKSENSLLLLIFRYEAKRVVYSTGINIPVKSWDDAKQKVKRNHSQYAELNQTLLNLTNTTLEYYRKSINDKNPVTSHELKELLDNSLGRKDKVDKTLFSFIEKFIDERVKSPKYSHSSIKVYKNAFNHLKEYRTVSRSSLDFKDISLDFFYGFTSHLFNTKQMNDNSVNKVVQTLKLFLGEATERGLNENIAFRSKRFSVPKKSVENIYLSLNELHELQELNLNRHERLGRVRDAFLIGAYTGLRFSDFTTLRPENISVIDGVEVLTVHTQKTGEKVVIPVHPLVRDILAKYEGYAPATISNQKMNQYLKEIGKLAKFTDKVLLKKSRAGKRYTEVHEKWELVSTHTARRSFATNAFKSGISSISIMKITGHKSETSFLKYIKVSKEGNAILMAENKFFNPNT